MAVLGTIYLLHFDPPYKHAKHYLGWATAKGLDERVRQHTQGIGARLVRIAIAAGSSIILARTWEEKDRHQERKWKARGKSHMCPICKRKNKPMNTNEEILSRYQTCAILIWELFKSDPLPSNGPHFWIERLEALLEAKLIAPQPEKEALAQLREKYSDEFDEIHIRYVINCGVKGSEEYRNEGVDIYLNSRRIGESSTSLAEALAAALAWEKK